MTTSLYLSLLFGGAVSSLALGLTGLARPRLPRWAALLGPVPAIVPAVARTLQVGHLPLSGLHETLLAFGVCLCLVATWPGLRGDAWRVWGCGLSAGGAFVGLAGIAPVRPTPLVPALQTLWFEIHVANSFMAYAFFGLAAAAGGLQLLGLGQGAEGRLMPRANLWGFACFTWGMVSGGIWAYLAWGTYWLWHVKELWSGILWTYYAGMVHLPHLGGWRGRRQAVLSVAGFGLVLFTYLGVGLLMRNTHRF